MKISRLIPVLAALLSAVFMVPSVSAGPPPLEAYGELPAFETAAISPSGKLIAVIATVQGTRAMIVLDRANVLVKSAPIDNIKVFGIEWAGEDHVLIRVSQTEDLPQFWTADQAEFQQVLIVPVNSNEIAKRVFERNKDIADRVFGNYGLREVDGDWKAYFGGIEMGRSGRRDYTLAGGNRALFEVDLKSNKAKILATDPRGQKSHSWLIDSKGQKAVTLETDSGVGKWRIFNSRGNDIASGRLEILRVGLSSFGFDGDSVIYTAENKDNQEMEWFEVPLDGSSEPVEIFEDLDIERFFRDHMTDRLLGFVEINGETNPTFADPIKGQIIKDIAAAFPNSNLRFVEWTRDFRTHLVRTSGSGDSGTWYVIDTDAGEAKLFGQERPLISSDMVGPVSTFDYSARDGLEMDGILTLPPKLDAKNLPVVVLPHGGPHAHDDESFDWWAQAFASRGYAVFQPNFRGSTSRDQAFHDAGYGEWGRKMQTDITDGLNALVEQGIVDRSRACIMGASYGGYAALAGVTIEQGIYRCAVAVAPVSDIALTINTDYSASGQSQVQMKLLKQEFGDGVDYDAISPRRLAAKADAPILLIHGREDTVVPYRQSAVMADALKNAGKPYDIVDLKAEDHWLTRSATRFEMLASAMKFILQHNPPD